MVERGDRIGKGPQARTGPPKWYNEQPSNAFIIGLMAQPDRKTFGLINRKGLWRVRKLLDFIKNILICVQKMNKCLTGLERHECE